MMKFRSHAIFGLMLFVTSTARAQLESPCVPDSPERRGELGCSIVETKPLTIALQEPLLWHIDQFDNGTQARAAVGPASIAVEAHGTWWLLSVESSAVDHHGGHHVTHVALPSLPRAEKYSMLVISAYVAAGLTSRVHTHSGVEAFYVVDGQQCLETQTAADTMTKGQSFAIAAGAPMRLVATGKSPRRALAVVVYDASQPPTTRMEGDAPKLVSCM